MEIKLQYLVFGHYGKGFSERRLFLEETLSTILLKTKLDTIVIRF